MLKKVKISELKVGTVVKELDCSWMDHPFIKGSFKIKNDKMLRKISEAGIKHAYIIAKGVFDVENEPSVEKIARSNQQKLEGAAKNSKPIEDKKSVAEEHGKAQKIFKEATGIIRNLMEDVRLGKQVDIESIDPLAERMIQSVFRNQHAFTGISRIKTKDEYTFMHCVSVAGLMVTFAKTLELNEKIIQEIAIGGLVHDVGKIMVPDKVLNKPGKLSDGEFEVMKDHVTHSREILGENLDISQNSIDVALLHHERMDGKGYPLGLTGDEISLIGKMSAIVDVYDALTSVRVYKSAWEPTLALKKMIEWSPDHFSRELVEKFISCLGIYPVGSLVQLESGRVGLVMDQASNMLRPKLRIIYNAKKMCYAKVTDIDLIKETSDKILFSVTPKQFGLNLSVFL